MKKIKWGIIGPGIIANQFAHDFKFVKSGELVAVASRSIDRAKDFAREYDIEKAYGNYTELFNDNEIDAVYIATPHNFHLEQSVEALKAGKAVLCEKPLTINPKETSDLIEVSKSCNTYLMEGMWTYFLPAVLKAQEWVNQGKIGRIMHIKADFAYPFPYNPENRWYNPKLAGGALLDIGIYCIAITWLFHRQDPKDMKVIARKASTGVDNDLSMLFEYENLTATLTTSLECKLHNWAFIIGDKGYIAIPDFWRASECFLYKGEKIAEHFIALRDSFGYDYETEAVNLDLLAGKKESEIMPLAFSMKLQQYMADVMKKF